MAADSTGWLPGVEQVRTSAWGYPDIAEDGVYPAAVVSHVAQGYMTGLLGIAQQAAPGKSWHFSIGRDGTIVQHVSIWDPAWHAGDVNAPTWRLHNATNPNKRTVGIEHEGFSIPPGYSYDYLYSQAAPWPEALIEASIRVHRWVFAQCVSWLVPSEDTVITHSMLNTRTRAQDPGDLWLATVRPRIIAALQVAPPPPTPAPDEFQRGRREMFDAWVREEEANLERVKGLREEWSIHG